MYGDFHFYIDWNWEQYFTDRAHYFPNLYSFVWLAYSHRASVFYSPVQLEEFVENCNDLDQDFTASIGNQIDIILKNASPLYNQKFYFEVIFANQTSHLIHVNHPVFKVMNANDKIGLISSRFPIGINHCLNITAPSMFTAVDVFVFQTTHDVIQWFSDKGLPRNFHISTKHGENGRGNWPTASPLRCSRQRAQLLLNEAFADFSKAFRFFAFDDDVGTYVEFFYEGGNPQKQWHGFHLTIAEWSRVPQLAREYFGH